MFEFKVITIDATSRDSSVLGSIEAALNVQGLLGWEVKGVINTNYSSAIILQRATA